MRKVIAVVSLVWAVIVFAVIAATIQEYKVTFILPNEQIEDVVKYNNSIKEPSFESDYFEVVGWYTDPGLTLKYSFNKKIKNDLVLYSKVVYTNSFQIYYDTFDLTTSKTELIKEGSLISELYIPTKEHYNFEGWFFEENFLNPLDHNAYIVEQDTILYAKFSIKTYQVTFLNELNEVIKTETVNSGENATAPILDIRPGYSFIGWDTEYSNVVNNITTKALYEKASYTNHLVFNNGEANETRVLSYKDPLNLSQFEPTYIGHNFVGWYTDANLTNAFDSLTMPDNDLVLYAKFNPNLYTLTFDAKNGSEKNSVTISFNEEISFPISEPVKEHYDFIGWYYNETLINENDQYIFAQDITLEAKYQKVNYHIDYISLNEEFTHSNDINYQINENNPLLPASLTGYKFEGWYLGNALVTNTNQLVGNVVLEARFTVSKYRVNFIGFDGEVIKTEQVDHGSGITPPPNPTQVGYDFIGWDNDFDHIISYINIRPIFEKITYSILYTSNEDNYYNPNIITTYQIDDSYILLDAELFGYKFNGWFINNEQIYNLNNLVGNIDLEARFTLETFNVAFLNHFNEEIETQQIIGGGSAVAPTPPDRVGYTFIGWDQPYTNVGSNLNVKALYEKTNYINHLVFNNDKPNETRTKNYGDPLNLSEKEPTYLGYTFSGWFTEPNFTTQFTDLTMPATNLTLYAKFNPNSYTISFITNSGQNFNTKTISFNQSINLFDVTPSKEHHTFIGWYFNDELISSGSLYNYPNNIVLEARYSKINYDITYSSATPGFDNPNNKNNYQIDENYLLIEPITEGYTFLGWYLGEVKVTNLNQVAGNINLEAKFLANTYNITYILPSGVNNPIGQITTFSKETVVNPLQLTRLGYQFIGWYTDSNLEEEFTEFSDYNRNLNLYPKFELINYTIHYNFLFDEQNNSNNIETYTIETEFMFYPANKIYHTFNHFLKDGTPYLSIERGTTGDITLTPVFTASAYIITYETSGKPLNNSMNPTVFIEEEVRIINAPTAVAYEFLGWYLTPNPKLEDLLDPEAILDIPITSTEGFIGNTTLYALWGDELEFSLNFITNYSSNRPDLIETVVNYTYGEELIIPILSQNASDVSDGDRQKDFIGWYLDEEFTIPFNQSYMGTSDITIYAKWTYRYIIYFNTDVDGVVINNLVVRVGEPIVNLKPANPTRVGYSFGGWYSEYEYINEFLFTIMPEEDVYLYAKWNPEQFTIEYVTNVSGVANIIDNNARYNEVAPYNTLVSNLVNKPKVFVGWFTNSNLLTGQIDLNTYIITSNTTLYAKWEEPVSPPNITIDYQNKTPDGKPVVDWYDSYNILDISPPVREGYSFIYFEVFNSDGNSLGNPETITILDDYTLVAIYDPNPITITIYLEGVLSPKIINTYYGEYLDDVLTLPGNIIDKEGFTIRNFYTDSSYQIVFNRSVILTNDQTLYARFDENTYIVVVETAPGARVQDLFVSHNGLINIIKEPLRSGYKLINWTLDGLIIDLETFVVTEDITIVAVWEKVSYQVILIDNELNTETPINYDFGSLIDKPPHLDNVSGKIFAGWYTDPQFEVVYVHERYMEAEVLRLYARYIERVDVEYYQVEDGVLTLLNIDIKNNDNKLNELIFDRYGYTTSGWYTDINLINTYDFNNIVSEGVIKLYTVWVPQELELTLVVNGQEDQVLTRYYNDELNILEPILVGYKFTHWTDSKGNIFTNLVMPNYDLTLTANFEVNTYLLQLNANSGTIDYITYEEDEENNIVVVEHKVESIVLKVAYGTELTDLLNDYRISKYAYLFDGWVESGASYELDKMPAKNMILNATFKLHFTIGLIFEEGISNGEEVWRIIGYNGVSKNILTPNVLYNSDGTERPVIAITDNAFILSKDIESIIIGDNIEIIGNNAFKGLKKLTSVLISENAKLKEIGVDAFKDATLLRTFDFPNSLVTIRDNAFMNTKITNFTISSNLETIGQYAFYNTLVVNVLNNNNSKLETIGQYAFSKTPLNTFQMPNTVKTIGNQAFSYTVLKSLILPEGIESVGTQLLLGNTQIEEMQIPNNNRVIYYFGNNNAPLSLKDIIVFDKGSKIIIDYFASGANGLLMVELADTIETINQYAFYNLKNLNTINLDNIKYIGANAFRENRSLRNINLSNVIEIGDNGFYYATALTGIYGPGESQLSNLTTIGAHAFRATNIISLNLPNVVSLGNQALYDVNNLVELHFSNKLTTIGSSVVRANKLQVLTTPGSITLGALFGNYNNMPVTLKTVNIAKGSEAIINNFGYYARYVRNYTVPSSVLSIGTDAFRANYELTTIDLSHTSITVIPSNTFYGASNLRSVILPETIIGIQSYAFYNSAVSEIGLPDNLEIIATYAFYGTKLGEAILPDKLTTLGNYAFGNIPTLIEVYIPSSVTSIGTNIFRNSTNIRTATVPGNRSISQYAISNNTNLTTVNVTPGSVSIMNSFLENYIHVKTVTVPSSVESLGTKVFSKMNALEIVDLSQTKITDIPTSTFENTLALKQVLLPDTLRTIGNSAFYNSNLGSLVIPNNLLTIGNSAFMNSNVESLEIPLSVNTIGNRAFESMPRLKRLIINNPTTTFVVYSTGSQRRLLINSINLEYLQIPATVRLSNLGVDTVNNLQTLVITPGSTSVIADFANANSSAKLKSVKEIILPETIRIINNSAFRDLTITKMYLPEGLEEIGSSAFLNSSIERITTDRDEINNLLPSTLVKLGSNAFSGSKIREVQFTSGATIEDYVFNNANLLETLIFDNDIVFPSNATHTLTGATSLRNLTINGSVKTLSQLGTPTTLAFLNLVITEGSQDIIASFASGYSSIISLELPDTLQQINASSFSGTRISEVIIPEGVLQIGNNAFSDNPAMSDFHITNGNVAIGTTILSGNSGLINISVSGHIRLNQYDLNMANYSSLVTINISPGSTHIVSDFAKNFAGVSEVNLPNSVKTIYANAFENSALHTINLENVNQIQASAFEGTELTSLTLSSSVISIGNRAFANTVNLTRVSLPASYQGGGNQMFAGAINISKLTIPSHQLLSGFGITHDENLILSTINISEGSEIIITSFLENFSQVRTVVIPNSVLEIGANAFKGTSIEKIVIPSSVLLIQAGAFNIDGLEWIEFLDNNPTNLDLSSNTFNGNLIKIYIPKDSLSLYELVMPSSVITKLEERVA